jgi:hypothetical protein
LLPGKAETIEIDYLTEKERKLCVSSGLAARIK